MKDVRSGALVSLGENALPFVLSSAQKAKSPEGPQIPCSLIQQIPLSVYERDHGQGVKHESDTVPTI